MTRAARTFSALLGCLLPAVAGCPGGAIVGLTCEEGRAECGGQCVDVSSDPLHCGGCGEVCGEGRECILGNCVGGGCPDELDSCDELCVDLDADEAHCGTCGNACDPGQTCIEGGCIGEDPCPGGKPCGESCVDPTRDPANCGECGNVCGAEEVCKDGACRLPCPAGRTDCRNGECVDLDTDPANCGGCGWECGLEDVCSQGSCKLVCAEGLVACGRSCVDFNFDPDHCGGCDQYCGTGICELGECLGGSVGHVVLVGHDYGRGRRDQNRVIGNALFIASGAPVQVLAYERGGDALEMGNVYGALDQVAIDTGRTYQVTTYDPETSLAEALSGVSAFLVFDQEEAVDGAAEALEGLGAYWAEDLARFLGRGGVLVVTDGGNTYRVLVGAGLLDVGRSIVVTGSDLEVTAAVDAVAAGVSPRYRAEDTSVAYETDEEGTVVSNGEWPVVLHQVFP